MSKKIENNKRIAKNTVFLYIRMLIIMFVTLYMSRVVLHELGVTDFGIYNVVGGVVSLLSFFTSSLSNATQRYINIGLGRNNYRETEIAFRQSLTLMLLFSIILLIIGETIGLWFVSCKMVVPSDRLVASVWVYHFSLISVVASINQVSFLGAIIAYEKMNVYAYFGLFEALSRLLVCYYLKWNDSIDSLILYSGLMAVISILMLMLYMIYCCHNFKECRIKLYWNENLVKSMAKFISYNLFGCISCSAGMAGTNILLNLFFGPTVNAARAISIQVSAVVARFTESIMTAVKPQVIKSYTTNDIVYMINLIENGSKYSFFLASVVAIPAMIEIQFILEKWLGNAPENTVLFTRLVLCDALIGVFISPLWIAANATGYIKRNQVYGRLFTLSILPVSFIFLKLGADSYAPFIISIIANSMYWIYSLYDIHQQINLQIVKYIKNVVLPSISMACLMTIVGLIVISVIPNDSFARFIVVSLIYFFVTPIIIYILLKSNEKIMLLHWLRKLIKE